MSTANDKQQLKQRIQQLEAEVARLKKQSSPWQVDGQTVRVPESMKPLFEKAQETVADYFSDVDTDPTKAAIKISGERYVLMRASSVSVDFLKTIKNLYADRGDEEAFAIGRSFLFDISHVIGREDARAFHEKMGVKEPLERLSTGPVHFAFAGWAFVDISDESKPSPDENYFIKYDHPFSFEADAWLKAGEESNHPVCIMNAGYSSGWCAESFGVELTAVELTCKAAGDDMCTFVMAPPHRIRGYLDKYMPEKRQNSAVFYQIPSFFERKTVEAEMKMARQKAEESDRLKSEFLTNISHEIRTPMNALIGMTELVLDTPLTSIQREHLNTVLDSADSLMAIINQILDFSKIESGKIELEQTSFLLREWVSDAIRPLEVRAEPKNIKLGFQVAENVPNNLRGDAVRLRQILMNLVGNGIKFTDTGSVLTAIAVEQPTDLGVMLHFAIRDTGVGIPPDKMESVFEAFTQVDMSTTRQFGGTGLGLAISARLVELLGGNIWVENNTDGPGVTFHFTAQFALDAPPAHPELVDQPVLVATDNPQHLSVLENAFRKLRMRVTTCDSAQTAYSILNDQVQMSLNDPTIDKRALVVADLQDNVTLVELIKSQPETRDSGIIVLNVAGPDDLNRLKAMGVDNCLKKPIKQSTLVAALKNEIAGSAHDNGAGTQPQASDESAILEEGDSGIKILLVEDGLANQKFAEAMLTRWGHEVAIANHGQEALDMLGDESNQFDIVLMDVLMPVMDGFEATAAIREKEQTSGEHMPIIAVTAQAMKGDREKCLAAGMDSYLSKPIRRRELQKLIKELVG